MLTKTGRDELANTGVDIHVDADSLIRNNFEWVVERLWQSGLAPLSCLAKRLTERKSAQGPPPGGPWCCNASHATV
jgi:hypothetical protein